MGGEGHVIRGAERVVGECSGDARGVVRERDNKSCLDVGCGTY